MTIDDRPLEERLTAELARAAPESLPGAPSVADLQRTVDGRRRRNRVLAGAAAAVLVVGIGGGIAVTQFGSDPSQDVIATAPDESTTTTVDSGDGDSESTSTADPGSSPVDSGDPVEPGSSDGDPVNGGSTILQGPQEDTTTVRTLQVGGDISIETQESAVEFAGGSGVFVVRVGDEYRGVAGRFGGDSGIQTIGLRSDDGLVWSEVEVAGVPAGATPTALTTHNGTAFALFSVFDVEEQRNLVHVGTSADLSEWTLAPALPGDDTTATGLAVGRPGVVVVGVAPNPAVWVGPIGGPLEQVGTIDGANTIAGVVAIDGGFVAVGTSEFGATLFDSVDGADWTAGPMSALGSSDNIMSLTVMDGTIMLAGDDGDVGWSASSSDGGQTWQRAEIDAGMVSTVRSSGNTVGFQGTSTLGTSTVTLSDGTTWSSADLDVAAPDRVELLVADSDQAVLLATVGETLTWIVASR